MTAAPQQCSGVEVTDDRLWCLYISGMDEVHAAPDRATAQLWAVQYTVMMHELKPVPHPYDPVTNFMVREWPWSPESHRADLPESIKGNTRPEQIPEATLTAHAQALHDRDCAEQLRKSGLITNERFNHICENIRARETLAGAA